LVRGDIGQRILEPDDWFLPHKGSSPGANTRYLQVCWWRWWDWNEKIHDHIVIILATVHMLPIIDMAPIKSGFYRVHKGVCNHTNINANTELHGKHQFK